MFEKRHIHYGTDDTHKKQSVHWYRQWLFEQHSSCRDALKEAVRGNFNVKDDDGFVSRTLREAYNDLRESKDPAVQYFIGKLTYLPKGSQWKNRDAIPEIEWSTQNQTSGAVTTPAGTCLGFIEKYADGAWGITPLEGDFAQKAAIAESAADARHYLVNRLTKQVIATEGEARLRIVGQDDSFFPRDPGRIPDMEDAADLILDTAVYELEFWDAKHGLHPGKLVSIELLPEEGQRSVHVLEGTVLAVSEQRVSITGTATFHVRRGH